MVCGDPDVLKRLGRFVPVAENPGRFRGAKADILEYSLLHAAMMQTEFAGSMERWHVQGLYVLTPSGKLLAGTNMVHDPAEAVRELDRGLERYGKLSKAERLLPRAPDPDRDRIPPSKEDVAPPEGGLILRMVSRGLPSDGISPKDTRHPRFYKLDRVWFTREEARAFVPSDLRPGTKDEVRRPVYNRILRLHLGVFVQPNLYWQRKDVKEAFLTSEIVSVTGDVVDLRFAGRARLESATNGRAFEADLLGKATFQIKTGTFSAFELLAIGPHTLGPDESLQGSAARKAPMGILFTLNERTVNDQVVPTFHGLYDWAGRD